MSVFPLTSPVRSSLRPCGHFLDMLVAEHSFQANREGGLCSLGESEVLSGSWRQGLGAGKVVRSGAPQGASGLPVEAARRSQGGSEASEEAAAVTGPE